MCPGIAGVFLLLLGVTGLVTAAGLTVAMLGAIDPLMSPGVADKLFGRGEKHNPNVERIAQGGANCTAPRIGGLPPPGARARSATNMRSLASTPLAGMIHALTL